MTLSKSEESFRDYNFEDESAESKSSKGFRTLKNMTQTGDQSVRDPEQMIANENRPIDKTVNDSGHGANIGIFSLVLPKAEVFLNNPRAQ